jgi:flagellar hook-length control protein FliK
MMDALSLQSAAPAAPAAAAAVNTAAAANNSAPTDEPASGEAAARPRHFGTLLALQLGAGAANAPIASAATGLPLAVNAGDAATDLAQTLAGLPGLLSGDGAQKIAKPAGDGDADTDVKRGRKAAADTATDSAIDPLAGLNLPGLPPLAALVTAVAPPPTGAATAQPAEAEAIDKEGRKASLAIASEKNTLPAVTTDLPHTDSNHLSDAINAARSDAAQFSRDLAALQSADGVRNAGEHAHSIDLAALNGMQGQPVPAAPSSAASAPTPLQAALAAQVGTPAWNTELGQKIVWMVGDQQQVAEIHVNPPNLGPLDIKLTIDGAQTTALFTSSHSEVREALEAALPRLREVLADSGIMLGNASVTADTPRDGRAFAEPPRRSRGGGNNADDTSAEAQLPPAVIARSRSLVDLFA